MRRAFKTKAPQTPLNWHELPAGAALLGREQTCLDALSQRFFGYHLLKIGALSRDLLLPQCAIRHHLAVGNDVNAGYDVVARASQLPFAEHSIDAVIMAHVLDYAQDPHAILREVERVLTHSGYVLLTGFNPFSLLALAKWFPLDRHRTLAEARFFSHLRIKDWLQLLSFDIIVEEKVSYCSLSSQPLLPWGNAVYVILARKRIYPLTPLRQRKRTQPLLHPHAGLSPVVGFQDVQVGPTRTGGQHHPF